MTRLLTNTHRGLRPFWHPVAQGVEVADGALHRGRLLGESFVLWRGPEGLVAFVDQCPHRGAPLSAGLVRENILQCAYHGWCFDQRGRGVHIPALGADAVIPPAARLTPVSVRESYGLIWIAPDEPRADLLEIDEWDDPSRRMVWLPPVMIHTSAGKFMDNFCDFGHFPFVHAGTFGAGEDALVGQFDVSRIDHGYHLEYTHLANNVEDPLTRSGEHPLLQPRSMAYTFRVPFTARLRIEYPISGTRNTIVTLAQPVDDATTRVYTCMLRNDIADDDAADEAVRYELAVLDEDIAMLERLAVKGLPLDLQAQAHTRADRGTVELRRCLAEAIEEEP